MLNGLKKVFSPIQMRLLKRGMCVACMMPLAKADQREDREDGTEKVICKCDRIYIYSKAERSYRRAKLEEV